MKFTIRSLYLCVNDMDRAIKFYEDFFETTVSKKDEIYSVFIINDFRLGLFAYAKVGEEHTYGNSCLPSIEVESLDVLKKKISGVKVPFPLTRIGDNWVCEIIDSEGNQLELTTKV